MRWLIANLLLSWLVLLVPGASAIDLARPQQLLPACCRTHGAHHCAMEAAGARTSAPVSLSWKGPGCPHAHLLHAALVLPAFLAAGQQDPAPLQQTQASPAAEPAALAYFFAGLPGPRGPPFSL